MDDLKALAERCEKATGPDRLADQAIGWIVGTQRWRGSPVTEYDGPAYTASLDAAMTLVPEGWLPLLDATDAGEDHNYAELFGDEDYIPKGCAVTLPLALCAAALRARATLSSNPSEKVGE